MNCQERKYSRRTKKNLYELNSARRAAEISHKNHTSSGERNWGDTMKAKNIPS